MAVCQICGKGPQFGHNVSHSMRHTKRQFKPNIQPVTIYEGGRPKKLKVCTKCLKRMSLARG